MEKKSINYLFISPAFDSMMRLKKSLETTHQSLNCDIAIVLDSKIDMTQYCLLAVDIFRLSDHPFELLATLREITCIPIAVFISPRQTDFLFDSFNKADTMLSKLLSTGADMILPMNLNSTITEYFGSFYNRHVFFQHQEQIRHKSKMIFRDELVIEPKRFRVSKAGIEIDLTAKEFELLNYFACNADVVITYDMIADRLWGSDSVINNAIFSAVKRLRRKIEPDPQNPTYIHTIYNTGYLFKSHIIEKSHQISELSAV